MHLPPNHNIGSLAGTPRAAGRGGAEQTQAQSLARAQSITETPIEKASDADAVQAGDQAGDRNADGRTPRDTFQRSDGTEVSPVPTSAPLDLPPPQHKPRGVDYRA